MKQLNLPRKKIALLQALVSLALIVLTLIFSFTPILSIDISDSALRETVQSSLDSMSGNVEGFSAVKIPEKLDVTMPKLVKADILMFKVIKVSTSVIKAETSTLSKQDLEKINQAVEDLEEALKDPEGQEAILTVFAAFGQVVDFFDNKSDTKTDTEPSTTINPDTETDDDIDDALNNMLNGMINYDDDTANESDSDTTYKTDSGTKEETEKTKSTTGEIIMMVIRITAMCYILLFITFFPIVVGIAAFISLIRVLSHLNNPEEVSGKIAGKMISYLSTVVTFALALTLFTGLEFGTGLTMIMILALVSILFNVVATRLRSYSPRDLRYVNIAQGTAAGAGIGAIVFFVNLLNVDILRTFFNSFGAYTEKLSQQTAVINAAIRGYNYNVSTSNQIAEFSANAGYVADVLIISVFGILALALTGSIIVSCAAQLGLTSGAGKRGRKTSFVYSGISAIICTILPFVVSNLKNQRYYTYTDDFDFSSGTWKLVIDEEVAGAIYTMPAETKSALIGMLIGAIIILAAGIVGTVLKKKYCSDLPEEWEILILNGKAPLPGEPAEATATADPATVESNENQENDTDNGENHNNDEKNENSDDNVKV